MVPFSDPLNNLLGPSCIPIQLEKRFPFHTCTLITCNQLEELQLNQVTAEDRTWHHPIVALISVVYRHL